MRGRGGVGVGAVRDHAPQEGAQLKIYELFTNFVNFVLKLS